MSSAPHRNPLCEGLASPYMTDLLLIFQNEFMHSFDGFTTSWRENCVFNFSPTVANTIREKLERFDDDDFVAFIEWIQEYIDSSFLPFQFSVLLQVVHADDEFFDIVLAVLEYLEEAFNTIASVLDVKTDTQEYRNKFGSVDPATYLVKKSSEMLFTHYGDRIMETICRRVRTLRKCHSYHDSAFWNSLSDTSLAKIADVLNNVPETARYGAFIEQYESELIEDVREYIRKIPLRISEKGFLIKMRECVDIEETIYNTLISPDVEVYGDCNKAILDLFRDVHEMRRAARIFSDTQAELVNPDAHFSAPYFRDIYALYIYRGDNASIENLRKLSEMIQESFVQILLKHVKLLGEAQSGPNSLQSFTFALGELSRRRELIKSRLLQIRNCEALLNALGRGSSQLSLSRLSTMGYENQMRAAEEYAISFLCTRNIDSDDEQASLALIAEYFSLIPQHARFMSDLYMKMRSTALQRIPLPMDRLKSFTNDRLVYGMVSQRVKSFIRDLNKSFGMGGNDETSFYDKSSSLKCDSCLVTRLRYWGSDKGHIKLRKPCAQLSLMQDRVAAHMEGKIGKDRRLIPMDSLSRVSLRITLFTKGRNFTRLDMLQHQYMILIFCTNKEPVRMSEIVRSMSAETMETEIEKEQTQKFIVLLVESLMRPYPLLNMTRDRESGPDDLVVSINRTFAFQEENVRLPDDVLLNAN